MLEMTDAGVKENNEIRVLRGVVYKINSIEDQGPNLEVHHIQVWQEKKLLLHSTRKERADKYDLYQSKA